ncbi:MAG: tRNA lysidine(34) synthetase TilS [Jannaschia sp.]
MAAPDIEAAFGAALEGLLPVGAGAMGLAVSGGSDSTALMHLAAEWARGQSVTLHVVTIDHGLRPEAAREATQVAAQSAGLGLPHQTLRWTGWDGVGNLQDAARAARYRLLSDWAASLSLPAVALGHTMDDDAETVLMGLSRGAGLDGLSGMRPSFRRNGVTFMRPLLTTGRSALRNMLKDRTIPWSDDPSNDDRAFQRIRARDALAALAPLGIDVGKLSASAANLRRTRAGLDAVVASFVVEHVRLDRGDIIIASDGLAAAPQEVARRVLNLLLRRVASSDYPPRAPKVMALINAPVARKGTTLHGCLIRPEATGLRISREPEAAARSAPVRPGEIWDGRWRVTGPSADMLVRATGAEGLSACPDWRQSGLPRASLMAAPAVWDGNTLVAAPLARRDDGWSAVVCDAFNSHG